MPGPQWVLPNVMYTKGGLPSGVPHGQSPKDGPTSEVPHRVFPKGESTKGGSPKGSTNGGPTMVLHKGGAPCGVP